MEYVFVKFVAGLADKSEFEPPCTPSSATLNSVSPKSHKDDISAIRERQMQALPGVWLLKVLLNL
jgi:hypothetical protein